MPSIADLVTAQLELSNIGANKPVSHGQPDIDRSTPGLELQSEQTGRVYEVLALS